jgi:quinoprotein glucose dehydrogenase
VHRGLRNPQELVFDDHGNLFTGDNDSDQGDQERLVYLVEGGDSGWRVGYQHAPLGKGGPWMSEGLWKPRFDGRPAYLLPPVCNIEDGPSGLTYYPGTGLTPEYAGHFFITHFKGSIARSGIQSYTLRENGATFVPTSSKQFMGGVLPTDVTFGPDGALYIADWVDGWPKSNKGRIYKITPVTETPLQLSRRTNLASILANGIREKTWSLLAEGHLGAADRRERLETQFQLVAAGKEGTKAFAQVLRNPKSRPLARLHAVWGLTQLGRAGGGDTALLVKLLVDADPEVRAQAAKGVGDIKYARAHDALVKALKDPAPRVQFFAAQSLGKLGNPASAKPLLELLRANDNKDTYLRFAASYALSKLDAPEALAAGSKDSSAAVRLGVLLAYRYRQDRDIAVFLNDSDPFIVREAAEAINDAPIENAYAPLAGKLASAPPADEALVVRALNANYRLGDAPRAQAIANYSLNDKATPEMRAEALKQLALWGKTPQRDRVVGIYRPMKERGADDAVAALSPSAGKLLGEGTPQAVQLAAIDAIGALELRSAAPALAATVANEKAAEAVRIAALKALDGFGGDEARAAITAAEKSAVPAMRLAAMQVVAQRAPERALPTIKRYVSGGTESEQRAAFEALGRQQGPQASAMLVGALDQLAAGKVQPGAQAELLDAVSANAAPAVKARWEKQQATWAAGKDDLAPYRYALAGGNPWRGFDQFQNNTVLP